MWWPSQPIPPSHSRRKISSVEMVALLRVRAQNKVAEKMFLRWVAAALHRRIPFPSQTVAASRHAKMVSASVASLSGKMEYLNQYGSKGSTWRWRHKDNWLWIFFLYLWTCHPKKNKVYVMKYLTMGVCIGYCAKGWWAVGKVLWFLNWVVGNGFVVPFFIYLFIPLGCPCTHLANTKAICLLFYYFLSFLQLLMSKISF